MIEREIFCFKYIRVNHYNSSVYFFNIPIFRKYEISGFPYIEILGVRKRISADRRVKRAIRDARNLLGRNFRKAIVLSSHSGETSLLLSKIAEQICSEKNTFFILTRPYHIQFLKLYTPNVRYVYCPELLTVPMSSKAKSLYIVDDVKVYLPCILSYFENLEYEMKNKPLDEVPHFYSRLLDTQVRMMGYSLEASPSKPKIFPVAKDAFVDRLRILGFNNKKIIILSPESVSNFLLPEWFWQKLSVELQQHGYCCVFNVTSWCPYTRYGHIFPTSYEEAILLAEKSECVIGLRSGFLDVVAPVSKKLIAIYTDFKHRTPLLPQVEAKRIRKCFSIEKLPYRPNKNYEIVLNNNYDALDDYVIKILKMVLYS